VRSVVLGALAHGAAIPVLPVHETVKEEAPPGFVGRTLDRGLLRLAQTPQGARSDWLLDALARAEADGVEVTDEAQALERAGYRVAVVPGDRGNLKITDARDLEEAKRRLGQGAPGVHAIRVGIGFDIHRFDRTDPPAKLVLGGIEFPGEAGLLGHSDADVVLHAAMDAILGALGAGDIGEHFPDDDPRFRGAASTGLLREVARISEQAGFEVVNLDLTLMAERPRIREKAEAMRRAIAGCLDVPESRIGLKATTLEKLGALGRGEGIACQAVVLLAARS
jgi:2-C-methyl-D-erythritol 2,4-cyclodiphosphate synthase